jgi:hypothetical protein
VNRARQFALIIGNSSCAMAAHLASQIGKIRSRIGLGATVKSRMVLSE